MKKLFFLFLFIIMSCSVYSFSFIDDTVIFDEPFNFSDLYTNHGYILTKGCATTPTSPISETMGLNNVTNYACGVGSSFYVRKYFDVNTTAENTYRLSFDAYIGDDDRQNETIQKGTAEIGLYETGGNGILLNSNSNMTRIYIARDDVSTVKFSSIPQAENCSFLVGSGYGHVDFIIDYTTNLYYLYVDDLLKCDGLNIGVHNAGYGRIFLYLIGFGGSYPINRYIDNIYISNGTFSGASDCSYPVIFCDNFDYATTMYAKDWLVYTGSNTIDLDFSPISNELSLRTTDFYSPYHTVDEFEVSYPYSNAYTETQSMYSPVFSAEFYANITDGLKYTANDLWNKGVIDCRADNDAGLLDFSCWQQGVGYVQVCDGCASQNATIKIKFTAYFKPYASYNFNSSNTANTVTLFINDAAKNTSIPFRDDSAVNLKKFYFVKDDAAVFAVDDYKVYLGTNPVVYDADNYYNELYSPLSISETIGEGDGDLATTISSFWDMIGIKSSLSKAILALFMLIMINIALIAGAWKSNINVSGIPLIIINFLFLMFFVFLNLISIWIPLVLVIIAAGIGAIIAKNQAGG